MYSLRMITLLIDDAKQVVARANARLNLIPVAGKRAPIYGANGPYGRPVAAIALNAADGATVASITATDVYGFQFDSPRFFDREGNQI